MKSKLVKENIDFDGSEYKLVRSTFKGLTDIIDGLEDESIETPHEFKFSENWMETLKEAHYLIGRLANRDLDKYNYD